MKNYLSEFIGTFALVFCGTGATIIDQCIPGSITHVGVAIVFGLIVMAMIYALGDKSGAHLNPAVTISFVVHGSLPLKQMPPYIMAQVAGAITASTMLKLMFPLSMLLGATIPAGSNMQSFVLEYILSFF